MVERPLLILRIRRRSYPVGDIVTNLFFFFSHLQFHVDIQDENDVRVARVSPFT